MPWQYLRTGERLEAVGRCGRNDQLAALPKNHEPIAGKRHRSGEESILTPTHLPGPQFDGSEALAELLASMESVEVPVVVHARRVVVREGLV